MKPNDLNTTPAGETRLYRVVAAKVEDLIREEGIQPGQRLPAERELATRLAVSRASLREALIALELSGVVEVKGGSGVYVSQSAVGKGEMVEDCPGPFEVLAARRLIEAEIAALAARHASPAAVDAIHEAMLAMEREHDDRSRNEQDDRNFHIAIARATGNAALVGITGYLWDQRGRLWHTLKEHFRTDELRLATLDDHRRIFSAIAAGDAAGARSAMRVHLNRVAKTFIRT